MTTPYFVLVLKQTVQQSLLVKTAGLLLCVACLYALLQTNSGAAVWWSVPCIGVFRLISRIWNKHPVTSAIGVILGIALGMGAIYAYQYLIFMIDGTLVTIFCVGLITLGIVIANLICRVNSYASLGFGALLLVIIFSSTWTFSEGAAVIGFVLIIYTMIETAFALPKRNNKENVLAEGENKALYLQ